MEQIIQTPIVEEMESSFLDYAMSVITDRAIPSTEDGLKPVHRRILYSMNEHGLASNKKYVKCATPVGDTISKYHPHGDTSTYGALVAMSQPWTMRYPLIDFHGNNGSRDGDECAAYRYTECRLSKYAESMLKDIKNHTIDFVPNFDETTEEPVYLPGAFPNLICNGTTGIAVAMACSFLPHNLTEVMNAILLLLRKPDASIDEILEYIQGPDFPTGGIIVNKNELPTAYKTGKGRARIRGEYHVETIKGHPSIVFTSIPYKVSKEALIVDIDKLCEEEKLKNVLKIRDESNRTGVRFVIELAKGTDPDMFAKQLYRLTRLEDTCSFNMVGLYEKKPKLFNIKQILDIYIAHQEDVLRRKTEYDKKKLSDKLHILEGMLIALAHIDEVIALIRNSESSSAARAELSKRYGLSEIQTKAIVDMKLGKLAKLEAIEIENEKNDIVAKIEYDTLILTSEQRAREVLTEELTKLRDTLGDDRICKITQIDIEAKEKEIIDVAPEEVVVTITQSGLIKRIPSKSYRTQKRSGTGIKNGDDIVSFVARTNTIDTLMVFSSDAKMYRLLVDNIPEGTNSGRGVSIQTLINFSENEKPMAYASLHHGTTAKFVFFATKNGMIKKVALDEYSKTKRATGIIALSLREGDSLSAVTFIEDEEMLLITKNGMSIRFDTKDMPISSRTAQGVRGIAIGDGDEVICCLPIKHKTDNLAVVAANGLGKQTPLEDFNLQNRGGKGLSCYKGEIAGAVLVEASDDILVIGDKTSIRISANDLPVLGRNSLGNNLLKGNSKVASISKI